jgi:hypothetical protein
LATENESGMTLRFFLLFVPLLFSLAAVPAYPEDAPPSSDDARARKRAW